MVALPEVAPAGSHEEYRALEKAIPFEKMEASTGGVSQVGEVLLDVASRQESGARRTRQCCAPGRRSADHGPSCRGARMARFRTGPGSGVRGDPEAVTVVRCGGMRARLRERRPTDRGLASRGSHQAGLRVGTDRLRTVPVRRHILDCHPQRPQDLLAESQEASRALCARHPPTANRYPLVCSLPPPPKRVKTHCLVHGRGRSGDGPPTSALTAKVHRGGVYRWLPTAVQSAR